VSNFTVILVYPDYVALDYPRDTYTATVFANDHLQAISLAQDEAVRAQGEFAGDINSKEDFEALVVIPGEVDFWGPYDIS
jgi:hypothetical protein